MVERLESRQTVARDLIRIECAGLGGGRVEGYAVNGSNLGIISDAARRLNAHPLRGWSVDLAAVAAGVAAYRASSPRDFELHYDECAVRARLLNLSILKSDRLCGMMRFGVPVSGDDGQLAAVAARPAPLPGFLSALYRGKAVEHPAVTWQKCDSVRVCGPAGVLVEADGEIFGRSPACFSVARGALRVAI
jgi:diacylglycerol kinase family enzyme